MESRISVAVADSPIGLGKEKSKDSMSNSWGLSVTVADSPIGLGKESKAKDSILNSWYITVL